MSLEELKTILQKGKESTNLPEFHDLAAHFEEFIYLYNNRSEALKNPQEAGAYLKKLAETQQRVQQSFWKTCGALGIPPHKFQEFLENPNHFTPEQWAQLEQIKKQGVGFLESSPSKSKKQRRRHLKGASKI